MTDRLTELGSEFKALRDESAQLRQRLDEVRDRLAELRPIIQAQIVDDARAGRRQTDIVHATGYNRDRVRRICREAGIPAGE